MSHDTPVPTGDRPAARAGRAKPATTPPGAAGGAALPSGTQPGVTPTGGASGAAPPSGAQPATTPAGAPGGKAPPGVGRTVRSNRAATPPRRRAGVRLVGLHALLELRSSFRSTEFAIGAMAVPVLLYAMFGLPNAATELPAGTRVGLAMLVSIGCYGAVSLAIFTFGEDVAKERGRGWPRTLAATPFPTWVHLTGKSATAVVHATLVVVVMSAVAAGAGGVRLSTTAWLALAGTLVSGVLLFSTLGFAIAYLARPRAATMIANLVFLPLSFASGFFFPLGELPDALGRIAPWLPTYHFGQLAYRTVMPAADVEFWVGRSLQPLWVHLVWVVASAVVLGAVTLLAARREAVTRRG